MDEVINKYNWPYIFYCIYGIPELHTLKSKTNQVNYNGLNQYSAVL